MKSDFQSKYGPWAVVTGASDGIGKAIVDELAACRMNIVLIARRGELLERHASQLSQNYPGIQLKTLALDLSQREAIGQIRAATQELEVGLFVASAGFGSAGEFKDLNLESEINMIDVNCRAVVEQTHYFANEMAKKKRGGIILFSSLVAFQGTPFSATYSATKSFIQNFAEALHFELKPIGINVLAVAPGPVQTGFGARAKMKMGSAAQPEEVARAILNSLGNVVTIRPGTLSKVLGYSLSTLNRWGRIQVMKKIMKGMAG